MTHVSTKRILLVIALYCVGLSVLQAPAFAQGASVQERMMDSITQHKVQIFSKSYCPYCKNVKSLFSGLKIDFHVDELDQIEDGDKIQEELVKLTGQRTVPNVFIGGKHVGGNDDTVKAKASGKLKLLLKDAGVTVPDEL